MLRQAGHLLAWCVTAGGRELARIEPTTRGADHQAGDVPVRLSRFAFCRSRRNVLVLESALAGDGHPLAEVTELLTWSAPVWSK